MSANKGKVLVIDDSSMARKIAAITLERAGYEVIVEGEANQVAGAISRERPDIVLMDVNMPAIQGNKLAELARDHPAGGDMILLLYSGKSADELETLARDCGADGFVQKNAEVGSLGQQIEMWMSRRAVGAGGA